VGTSVENSAENTIREGASLPQLKVRQREESQTS